MWEIMLADASHVSCIAFTSKLIIGSYDLNFSLGTLSKLHSEWIILEWNKLIRFSFRFSGEVQTMD